MAIEDFHPGSFNFEQQDIRIFGQTLTGGPSISGIEEPIATDGGGRWVADFENGWLPDRETNLYWRRMLAMMESGATPVNVIICDARHQPIGNRTAVPHSDETPFDDESLYYGGGEPTATSAQNKVLRSVVCRINFTSERPLLTGEMFSIDHPNWGHRAYRVIKVTGVSATVFDIEFRPPLREAITVGTVLDFNRPKFQARMVSQPSNAISMGQIGEANISFVEDMRKPAGL